MFAMKNQPLLAAILLGLTALSLSAAPLFPFSSPQEETLQSKPVSRPSVSLYVEANFKGRATKIKAPAEFANEIVMKTELGISNDSILSIKVPAGVKVTVFDGANFNGASATFVEGEHANLGSLAHRVSSFKVEAVEKK